MSVSTFFILLFTCAAAIMYVIYTWVKGMREKRERSMYVNVDICGNHDAIVAIRTLEKIFNNASNSEPTWLNIDDMCVNVYGTFVIDMHEPRNLQTTWRMSTHIGWCPTFSSRQVRR